MRWAGPFPYTPCGQVNRSNKKSWHFRVSICGGKGWRDSLLVLKKKWSDKQSSWNASQWFITHITSLKTHVYLVLGLLYRILYGDLEEPIRHQLGLNHWLLMDAQIDHCSMFLFVFYHFLVEDSHPIYSNLRFSTCKADVQLSMAAFFVLQLQAISHFFLRPLLVPVHLTAFWADV